MLARGLFVGIALLVAATFFFLFGPTGHPGSPQKEQILRIVADLPLPGPPVRFDYQSLDASDGRLYISHTNADQLVVFDTKKRHAPGESRLDLPPLGVIAVPELARIFASVTGDHQIAVVDRASLKTLAKVGEIRYPDGLAYAPQDNRVFVSDEHGDADAVIDAANNTLVTTIPLGGGAGNTLYDSGDNKILVAVHGKNELVKID